jgi:8-oxo-dGTP pyrophosphatase MutT (NUDIX family)
MSPYARRTARVLLIDSAGRILLIRSALVPGDLAGGYGWFTPGGGVEGGEGLAGAAARELAEEVGLRVGAEALHRVAYTSGYAEEGLLRDDFFLYRVGSHQVDTTRMTAFERSSYGGWRWWTVAQLRATTETVYPVGLADLVHEIIAGEIPAAPVELPWN